MLESGTLSTTTALHIAPSASMDRRNSEGAQVMPLVPDNVGARYVAFSESRVEETSPRILRAYFGHVRGTEPGPQAFLVDDVRVPSRAHFHATDQFQVFFGAPGVWYKSTPVEGLVLHYADAHVTYGPFGTDDQPFSFFTLRAKATARTNYLPENQDQLPPPPRPRHRNIYVDVPVDSAGQAGVVGATDLIEPVSDGLFAEVIHLAKNERRVLEQRQPSSGRFYCVLGGALRHGASEFGPRSLAWVPAEVVQDEVAASDAGCTFLVMQFPSGDVSIR